MTFFVYMREQIGHYIGIRSFVSSVENKTYVRCADENDENALFLTLCRRLCLESAE